MAVNITVLSTFNDAGLKKARAEMDKLSKSVQTSTSKTVRSAGAIGAGVLAGAGVAVGALYSIGSTFDDAYDNLRANTGKTGAELDGLKETLKTVATTTATSFGEASGVIGVLNSKLGLTGQPLADVTKNLIDLSRITGTDLTANTEGVAKAFQNFGVVAGYQAPALDVMYRASQQTGVSVADLAKALADSGGVLRLTGMDFQTSTAFLAALGKAGVDAGDVMPALQRGLKNAAKAGQDAGTYLTATFEAIKNAPNDIVANQAAFDAFGKSGGKMAGLIREGKLSFDDLKASLAGGDTISQASTDTEDFSEKFTKLKNRIMLAAAPFAEKVFDKVGEIMDFIGPKIDQVTKFFQEHEGIAKAVAFILGGVLVIALIAVNVQLALMAINVLAATWPIVLIIAVIALLVAGFIYAWNHFDWFRNSILTAWELIKQGFQVAWDFIQTIFNGIWGAVQWVYDKFIWLKDNIGGIFEAVGNAIVAPFKLAFNTIVDIWNGTIGGLSFTTPSWLGPLGGKTFSAPTLMQWKHTGGIVGGLPGASVPTMLQTGEMVLSQDQQSMLMGRINGTGGSGGVTINVSVSPTADKAAIGQTIAEALAAYERRSGSGWRA